MTSGDDEPERSARRAGLDPEQARADLLRALAFASPPFIAGSTPVAGFSARAWARVATTLAGPGVEYGSDDVSWFVTHCDDVQASSHEGLIVYRLPAAAATASERRGSFEADRVAYALLRLCDEMSDDDRVEQRQLETDLPALFAAGSVSYLYELRVLADATPRYLPVLYRTLVLLARRLYEPGDPVLTAQERAAATYLTFAARHPVAGEDLELLSATLAEEPRACAGESTEDTLGFRVRLALGWIHVGQLLASRGRRPPAIAASRAALRSYEELAAAHGVYRQDVTTARRQLRAHQFSFLRPRPDPTHIDPVSADAAATGVPPRRWVTVVPILAGGVSIVAGIIAWVATGQGRWSLVGLAAGAALASGAVHYRWARARWPRTVPAIEGGYADIRDLMLAWLPEFLVALTVGLLSAIGVAISASGGDWRWSVTGLSVGAVAPLLAAVSVLVWIAATEGGDEDGQLAFAAFLVSAGVPAALLAWMWTGKIVVFLATAGLTLACALLMFLGAMRASEYDE